MNTNELMKIEELKKLRNTKPLFSEEREDLNQEIIKLKKEIGLI